MIPAISVIMPVYNIERFIKYSVESIIKQSFSDFEFIIIDDLSTDETRKILDDITDSRIIRINNSVHTGNYNCRNQGLEIAKGEYIAVMDGDDIAYCDRLLKQYKYMKSNPQFLCIGSDVEFLFETGQCPVKRLRNPEEINVYLLQNNVCFHPTLLLRSDIFTKFGIRYNEEYYYSADYDLILNISRIGKITNIEETLLYYRCHDQQISNSKKKQQTWYADQIRLKQLSFLKIRPSVEEIIVHLSLMNLYFIPDTKLTIAEKWCNKILSKNRQLQVYDQEYLYSFLESLLTLAILRSKNPRLE